ncbi:CPBP family intramembrane glutamic endopeptidase [Parapedobacter sp. 10938]|uniref:CPBP family intramembrane glutamic endopeptidase n=1 Tax=Parapedobacter flavus TaxID=3110225 RepID=UPI002DBF2E06|nr:CPBP family intramembrane glutamic endopeptidase [Parapedobacter sp. 10938]MEC3879700.1 CPBP family intramembrane glutamic endopeptidase [Parapedobacter sp. 10938]
MFRSLFNDLRLFLRDPQQIVDGPHDRPFRTWLAVLIVDIAITSVVIVPLIFLIDEHVLHLRPGPEITRPMTFWFMVTLVIGVAPVMEELFFRYPLKFVRNRVLKVAMYISSVFFGLYHLSNYANQEVLFYALAPIIVGSQLLGGFLLAYLRLKYGLRWAILLHAVFNALFTIPTVLLYHGKTIIDHQSSEYSLVVTEYAYVDRPERMRISRKDNGIDTLIVRQMGLQSVLDSIGKPETYYIENVLVDIDLRAAYPIPLDSLINRLGQEYKIIPHITLHSSR